MLYKSVWRAGHFSVEEGEREWNKEGKRRMLLIEQCSKLAISEIILIN